MKKMNVNGVEFCNFGSNNYSYGMELISCSDIPDNFVQDVLAGKYPGVYLHPRMVVCDEFYGFFGTKDQYEKVYKRQKGVSISEDIDYYLVQWGTDLRHCEDLEYRKARKLAEDNYEDWWQIFKEK